MEMHFLALSSVIVIISNMLGAIILFSRSKGKKVNIMWGYFCLSVVVWGVGSFKATVAASVASAFMWWQIANISSILTPIIFYHFVVTYLKKSKNIFTVFIYFIGVCLLLLNFLKKELFIGDIKFMFNQFYYIDWTVRKNLIYLIFYIGFYWLLLLFSFFILLRHFYHSRGIERNQLKYFIIGMMIGFLGAHLIFLPAFGVKIYPSFNILIGIYPIIIGYAIVRYRLMDITIVITRTTIFVIVYSLVLGIPFWVGFKLLGYGVWLIPVTLMSFFATIGPFIYLYIQKRTEERLLQEQHRYQATLRQASAGMGKIKDLKKLLNLIVFIVTRAVRLEHTLIYVYRNNQLTLGALKRRSGNISFIKIIPDNSPLISYLIKTGGPIIYDEIKQKVQDYNDEQLKAVEKIVNDLEGELVLPILIDNKLLAIVVLGKKASGKLYSEDDLSVFSILANQAALAIENAQFYEDMRKTHEQLFQAEKMATIGTMADGLSHQINNRFHSLGFIAGDALDTIKLNKDEPMPDKLKEVMTDLERAFVRVQENVKQGGEVVQGLLRYTRKGDSGFTAVDFSQVFKSAFEMAQFKIKTQELKIVHAYDANIPKIKGNFTQLQEVFFNLTDNAYDAMMQRKHEKKEPGFQPTLTIKIKKEDSHLEIIFEDNGIGVKEEDVEKLFTPFFTTKLSSKKGTGLGLYVIKKIIEENHKGKVEMRSKYMSGTQMVLELPIAIE